MKCLLFSLFLMSTQAPAQQKKGIPAATQKSNAMPAAQSTYESLKTAPAQQPSTKAVPQQSEYDKYQNSRTVVAPTEERYNYNSVIKLNFMGLIFGGINLDLEKRMAPASSIILGAGYYPRGILKGSFRAGVDFRKYLGTSYMPKGLFVSAGALYHFVPYDKTTTSGGAIAVSSTARTSAGLLNLRGFVGYQFVTGHFTFEAAGGPAYSFFLSDSQNLSDKQSSQTVGFLPAVKLSLGYAF